MPRDISVFDKSLLSSGRCPDGLTEHEMRFTSGGKDTFDLAASCGSVSSEVIDIGKLHAQSEMFTTPGRSVWSATIGGPIGLERYGCEAPQLGSQSRWV